MFDRFYFFKGRVALYAILKAMGIGPGDEVILPGFTCVVVPNAIMYLGAKPVYVDIDPKTFNIDAAKLEELLTSHSSQLTQPKAVIVQHTFGIPAEMDKIIEIARRYNLYVIEDSCHALGSKYKGKEMGAFGDAAFFSSQWSKPVTTGLGGWAAVNDDILKERMDIIYSEFIEPSYKENLLLRLQYLGYSKMMKPSLFWFIQDTYRSLSKNGLMIGSSSEEELECKMPKEYEKKMTQWQINLLEKKLMLTKEINDHRILITSVYKDLFAKNGMNTVALSEEYEPVFLRYPLLVRDKRATVEEAKKKRIELGDWFLSPVHPNLKNWEKAGYKKGLCPNAEEICKHIINLPTHQWIDTEEAQRIVEFILKL